MGFKMTFDDEAVKEKVWPPLPSMAELIKAETKKVDFVTSVTILNGFDYTVDGTSYHFSFGAEDQSNFIQESIRATQASQSADTAAAYRAHWRGHLPDGSAVTLEFTLAEFMQLLMFCGTNKSNILAAGWDKKAQLQACTTKAELKAKVDELGLDEAVRDAREIYHELNHSSEFEGM